MLTGATCYTRENGKNTHFVQDSILFAALSTSRVQIVCEHAQASFLCSGYREGSDSSEAIDDDIAHIERVDKPRVLSLQAGVPVDGREVEAEPAIALGLT